MRSQFTKFAVLALVGGTFLAAPPASTTHGCPGPGRPLEVYVVELPAGQVEKLEEVGIDAQHATTERAGKGLVDVEAVITEIQAQKLRSAGMSVTLKRIDGERASLVAAEQNAAGYDVFRPYSGPGGIADELRAAAAAHPRIAKLVTIGKTVQGKDILALKVTKEARSLRDGKRPSVLYAGAQHAREWITPEMNRRLMHYYLDGYGTNAELTRIVNTTELWFLPVANPDGYDFTFTDENRLWRKNLRDNDGDGTITPADGVDPNRNFAVKWGWDNEGSSDLPDSETYRGTGPNSEPETQALDRLFNRVGFEFFINYHSAAELLLYGIGWQVSTPSPDDVIYEAMVGDDENPAIPGYDPDISAELYTTNGDTDSHATVENGTLGFTPEMTTCQTASESDPDDEWEAEDCVSGFNFPDDEELIQAEFEKNIPFALAVAKSAQDPDDPVSVVGRDRRRPRRRPVRRLLRQAAAGRGHREAGAQGPAPEVLRERRPDQVGQDVGSGGAVSATGRPTTTTTPSSGARSRARSRVTRSRSGSPGSSPGPAGSAALRSPTRWQTTSVATYSSSPRRTSPAPARSRAWPARSTPTTTPPR